jgi:hypothetical protein
MTEESIISEETEKTDRQITPSQSAHYSSRDHVRCINDGFDEATLTWKTKGG